MTATCSLKYRPLQSLALLAAAEFGRICNSELIKYKLFKESLETLQSFVPSGSLFSNYNEGFPFPPSTPPFSPGRNYFPHVSE